MKVISGSNSNQRLMPILAASAVIITLASTLVVYWMGGRVTAANADIVGHHQVIQALEDTLSTLRDAETGQRGFLLTGDEAYVEPYTAAVGRISGNLAQIKRWAATGRLSPAVADKVQQLAGEELAELAQNLELRRQQGLQKAMAAVRQGRAKRIMDELRSTVGHIVAEETRELTQHEQGRDQASLLRTLVAMAMGLVTCAFLAWAYLRIRRQAVETQQQQEFLAVTLSSIGDGVIVTDAAGEITFLNGEAERLTGWKMDEALGQPLTTVFSIVHEATRQPVESPVAKVLRLGTVVGLANHTVLVARDGRETPIDDSGAPIHSPRGGLQGVVLVFRDFSEHKQSERVLRESEGRFRALFETMGEGFALCEMIWDEAGRPTDWCYLEVNPAFERSTGLTAAAVRGRRVSEVIPGIEPYWIETYGRIARSGKGERLAHPVAALGRHFEVDAYCPFPGRFAAVFRDVTERKQTEQALLAAKLNAEDAKATAEAARQAAEKANRTKDHFLAVLSHELRTPLTPALATVTMLQEDTRFDAQTLGDLQRIRRSVEREARLIDDLLDITRIERGKLELDKRIIDLDTVLRRAAEVCMPDMQRHQLQFTLEALDIPYLVNGDPGRLEQVFCNLLTNAAKFTPAGGSVAVSCRRDEEGYVLAEVSDSGKGIEAEVLPTLFKAFEQGPRQTTRQFGGLGLGLAISQALVKRHDGTLTVWSAGKDKGATFRVRLPLLLAADKKSPAAATPESAAADDARLRLLLVEDDEETGLVLQRMLAGDGHDVTLANTMGAALQSCHQTECKFDLLLSDLGLPDGSGWELMRTLRQRGWTLPGIALSGFGQAADLAQSREAGFAQHVTKPVSASRLREIIASVRGSHQAAK